MLTDVRKTMHEQSENFNKERKYKKVSKRNHKAEGIITEMKNSMEQIYNRLHQMEERIHELEYRAMEFLQSEGRERKKERKKE